MTDFKVDAELVIRTQAAARGMEALSSRLSNIASGLRGAQGAGMGFMGSMLATNAITAGMGLLGAGIHHATSGLIDLTTQMQGAQIGIAAMVAGFQHVSFEQAQGQAAAFYQQIQQIALRSTATSSELQDAFQTMYASMSNAGMNATQQMATLEGTATAAAAYMSGDLGQTSRDMSMILGGMAGQQVKLWRAISGQVGMTAEQWNEMAKSDPTRAAARVQELLGSDAMQAAGRAYGLSLAGAMSSAQDYFEHFKRSAFTPIATAIGAQLNRMNGWLEAHREQLDRFLSGAGLRMAHVLQQVMDWVGGKLLYVADHWDEISERIQTAVGYARALIPHLMATAKVWMTVRLGMLAAAAALQASARAAQIGGAIHQAAAFFQEGGTFLGAGLAGAGTAAGAGAAAGEAAAGGTMMGGVMASLETVMAALSPLVAPLVGIIALIGSVLVYVTNQWDRLSSALAPFMVVLGSVYTDFMTFGESLWALLEPFAEIIGAIVTFFGVIGGGLFLGILKLVSTLFRGIGVALQWVADQLQPVIHMLTDEFTYGIEEMGRALGGLIDWMDTETTRLALKFDKSGRATTRPDAATQPETSQPPVTNINNARITVNQEFREADPDRVAIRMIEDIARFAEQRIMSGMAPALTR